MYYLEFSLPLVTEQVVYLNGVEFSYEDILYFKYLCHELLINYQYVYINFNKSKGINSFLPV